MERMVGTDVDGAAKENTALIEYTPTEYQYRYYNWLCPEETRTPDCYCYPFAGYRCRTCKKDCDVYEERLVCAAHRRKAMSHII